MESEDQQIDELKQWWKENGRAVVLGVVLGVGGVGGWVGWQRHVQSTAEAASTLYSRLVNTAAIASHEAVLRQTNELMAEFPNSGYAPLAAMVGARSAYRSGDSDTAIRLLRYSIEHAPEPELAHVARIRLARVLSEKADFDGALSALDAVDSKEFSPLASETRGDVLVSRGDQAAAREAYATVLASTDLPSGDRLRVQSKLDQIAAAGS